LVPGVTVLIPPETLAARALPQKSVATRRKTGSVGGVVGIVAIAVTCRCQWMTGAAEGSALAIKKGLRAEAPGESGRGSFGRGRAVVALAALHLLQHDAVEEHGQLGGANLQAGWPVAGRDGEAKYTFFKSLIPQAPAVFLPGQNLQTISRAVAEDK